MGFSGALDHRFIATRPHQRPEHRQQHWGWRFPALRQPHQCCDSKQSQQHRGLSTLTTLRRPLKPPDARAALDELRQFAASTGGHAGAMVYDALHCVAAGKCKADKIITRNKAHFDLFAEGIAVEALW